MNRRLLVPFLAIALIFISPSFASAQDVAELYGKAKKFMNQGKLDSATHYLYLALSLAPDDLAMQEDQVYLEYLKRDFAKAITVGRKLVMRPDAGIKTFQLLGMAYKEIAEYKEARKLYELAFTKFPNSGLLYAEYGGMYSDMGKKSEAIRIWERGIEMDPGYGGNYYFATFHYAENKNPVWAMIYGENFVNIESFTDRTTEVRNLLAEIYKRVSTPGYLISRNNPFAFAVAGTLSKQPPVSANNVTVEALTSLRMAFIREWYLQNNGKFPYKLFEYQDQLIKEGLFDAYNQWLFGQSLNPTAYTSWVEANKDKMTAYQKFVGGRVYKIPSGQYYQTK